MKNKNLQCILRVFIITMIILLSSCAPDFYDLLREKDYVPVVSRPRVVHFAVENGISLEWDVDPGACYYLLYRDRSPAGSFSHEVYRGEGLSFVDNSVQDSTFYYYKLAKVKGKTEFAKSGYVAGIAGGTKRDSLEVNGSKSMATPIIDRLTPANIFYYRDSVGNEVEDRDWYSLRVPANRTATVKIWILNDKGYVNNSLACTVEEKERLLIFNGREIKLENTGAYDRVIHFQISVNKELIGNAKTVSYQIDYFSLL